MRDGLIDEAQAEAIRARYAEGAASQRRARLITTLATIGAWVAWRQLRARSKRRERLRAALVGYAGW